MFSLNNKKAVLLMGPSAVGKTALSLMLSEMLPIEIISVDSALIYKDMDIGTAKPLTLEQTKVPHHLIDIITPLETYSVAQFINACELLIPQILQRGKLPVLVGGTMMYYNAILNGLSILPPTNPEIRAQLEMEINNSSIKSVYAKLASIDPEATQKIASSDKQRIIRALEVYYISGKPLSILQKESKINKLAGIRFLPLAIMPKNEEERAKIYCNVNQRFDDMLQNGFLDEVEQLLIKYPLLNEAFPSMRSVGYFEAYHYLTHNYSYQRFVEEAKTSTRHLVKRQITWLRKMQHVNLNTATFNLDVLFDNLKEKLNGWIVE